MTSTTDHARVPQRHLPTQSWPLAIRQRRDIMFFATMEIWGRLLTGAYRWERYAKSGCESRGHLCSSFGEEYEDLGIGGIAGAVAFVWGEITSAVE